MDEGDQGSAGMDEGDQGSAGLDDGEPGYCACCREFHLLRRVEIPQLTQPVDVCQYCAALGSAGLALRIAGLNEDGSFGYEDPRPAALPGKRRRRDRLAESFLVDDDGGFGPPRRTIGQRGRIAWLRLRGRI
jgi:hypothetical protein